MIWSPPDVYASSILSIGGGVLAGFVVVLIEWCWRLYRAKHGRRKAIIELRLFFREWESLINTAEGLNDPQIPFKAEKHHVQFVHHKNRLWTVPIVLSRWSPYLSEQQAQEIALLIANHENAHIGIVPPDRVANQWIYDNFFNELKKIKWLNL